MIGSEAGGQREAVGAVVTVDRCSATERPDRRLGLPVRKVALSALVPGGGVLQSNRAVRFSRRAGEQDTHGDQRAEHREHDDLPMNERGFALPIAGLAMRVHEGPATTSA